MDLPRELIAHQHQPTIPFGSLPDMSSGTQDSTQPLTHATACSMADHQRASGYLPEVEAKAGTELVDFWEGSGDSAFACASPPPAPAPAPAPLMPLTLPLSHLHHSEPTSTPTGHIKAEESEGREVLGPGAGGQHESQPQPRSPQPQLHPRLLPYPNGSEHPTAPLLGTQAASGSGGPGGPYSAFFEKGRSNSWPHLSWQRPYSTHLAAQPPPVSTAPSSRYRQRRMSRSAPDVPQPLSKADQEQLDMFFSHGGGGGGGAHVSPLVGILPHQTLPPPPQPNRPQALPTTPSSFIRRTSLPHTYLHTIALHPPDMVPTVSASFVATSSMPPASISPITVAITTGPHPEA